MKEADVINIHNDFDPDKGNPDITKLYTGKIFFLNQEKGWGFITSNDPDINLQRIYFHWTSLLQSTLKFKQLQLNMIVRFECSEYIDKKTNKSKGMRALKIEVLGIHSKN